MKYRSFPVNQAVGTILAHSLKPDKGPQIRKGTVLTDELIERISSAGIADILAVQLEPDDVIEDEAAKRLAGGLASNAIYAETAATGRVNLYAETNGLFVVDADLVNQLNRVNPGITLATLDNFKPVTAGRMVATIKIIPYSVSANDLNQALAVCNGEILGLAPFKPMRIGVVSTRLPHLKESVIDKTVRVLNGRLAASGSVISREIRTAHLEQEIADATGELIEDNDIVLIFGASAICDIDDYIPAAIRKLGGYIEHFGMPVDPGNLLLIGELNGKPVVGAPGCARSPAENGFDWVLDRLLAGRKISADEITGMGVGGLLMEIGTRPRPREASKRVTGKTAAVILAAGQSRRMGKTNKLAATINGKPLVRHVGEAAIASTVDDVIVVTGHEGATVKSILEGLDVRYVDNPSYAEGLSSSLAAGAGAIGKDIDRAIILLADMPQITSDMIDRLIEASRAAPPGSIILSTFNGKRGNPVLWPSDFFNQLAQISGDVGARHLIGENAGRVVQLELGEAAGFDIDTEDALVAAGGKMPDTP